MTEKQQNQIVETCLSYVDVGIRVNNKKTGEKLEIHITNQIRIKTTTKEIISFTSCKTSEISQILTNFIEGTDLYDLEITFPHELRATIS